MNKLKINIKRYGRYIHQTIAVAAFASCMVLCAWETKGTTRPVDNVDSSTIDKVNTKVNTERSIYVAQFEQARKELIQEVEDFIKSVAPRSKVSGDAIVDGCLTYNVDIKFVLAQGLCESHFGTYGVAARTNSIFNVAAYDGRSANDMIRKGKGYEHPDHSVVPYLQLLRNRYLVNGKTEQDLLRNYVDKNGYRYATGKRYEGFLRSTYKNIERTTDINKKYKKYRQYQILLTQQKPVQNGFAMES